MKLYLLYTSGEGVNQIEAFRSEGARQAAICGFAEQLGCPQDDNASDEDALRQAIDFLDGHDGLSRGVQWEQSDVEIEDDAPIAEPIAETTTTTPETNDNTPAWFAPRIEFLSSGTDADTVLSVLTRGFTDTVVLRVTTTRGEVFDGRLVDASAEVDGAQDGELDDTARGMEFQPTDAHGNDAGERRILPYVEIAAIGIY